MIYELFNESSTLYGQIMKLLFDFSILFRDTQILHFIEVIPVQILQNFKAQT